MKWSSLLTERVAYAKVVQFPSFFCVYRMPLFYTVREDLLTQIITSLQQEKYLHMALVLQFVMYKEAIIEIKR